MYHKNKLASVQLHVDYIVNEERDVHFLEEMQSVIAPNRWTIATTANTVVFTYFHLQAGVQVCLINWRVGC